jgi:hypothetical protein
MKKDIDNFNDFSKGEEKKYNESDIIKALFKGFDYCLDNMDDGEFDNYVSSEITQDNIRDFLKSLDVEHN